MPKSIRIMQTIVAYHDYQIWQIDIKIAFHPTTWFWICE
jgi:hypothetical protein